jgi:hypothetical protein
MTAAFTSIFGRHGKQQIPCGDDNQKDKSKKTTAKAQASLILA